MGREAAVALFSLADSFAALANAKVQQAEGVDEHPLLQAGISPEQLMALASAVHGFGHQASMFPDADSVGALSDRINSKQGEYPLNIVVDQGQVGPLPENAYLMSEMVEMGRLAQLPAALSTPEERERYLTHPLVRQGLPSFIFVQLAAREQTFVENAAFEDITRSLMDDDPSVFGSPAERDAAQNPPFRPPAE